MKIRRFIDFSLDAIKALLGLAIGIFIIAVLFPEHVPFGTPSETLLKSSNAPILDMHLHIAGLGYGGSGCFVSDELNKSYKKFFYLRAFGVSESDLRRHGDAYVVDQASELVRSSKYIDKAVVLAMDGVYDDDGTFRREKTQVFIPNEFVRDQVKKHDTLIYGASINPNRRDAIEQLRQAKEDGAVLVKWIPSIMHIDPADERFIPFYQTLRELDLPLLTHAGQERSFAHALDEYGDPQRLELPLSLGVNVIAAHIATTGTIEGEEMIDRLLPLFKKFPNLLTDISSLTQINKLAYVEQGLLNQTLTARMLYGSDWPLQFFPLVSAWYHLPRLRLADIQYIQSHSNVLDRDYLLKRALGVPESVFGQSAAFLKVQ